MLAAMEHAVTLVVTDDLRRNPLGLDATPARSS
jgi:hypothetical protein